MFSFQTVGHFFASLVHDIKVGAEATAQFISKNQSTIDQDAEIAATLISAADPALAPIVTSIERAGEALLGEALAAVNAVSAAANSPVTITLDIAAVNELKQLGADISKLKGAAAVPPASLTTPKAA